MHQKTELGLLMTDRSDAFVVRWEPDNTAPRRALFEPRVDGWYRREQIWTGDCWRTLGTELVETVAIENPPADDGVVVR